MGRRCSVRMDHILHGVMRLGSQRRPRAEDGIVFRIDLRFFTCSTISTISTISISNWKIFRRGRRFRGELFDGPGERRGLELWVEVVIGGSILRRLARAFFLFRRSMSKFWRSLRMTWLSRDCAPLLAPFTAGARPNAG